MLNELSENTAMRSKNNTQYNDLKFVHIADKLENSSYLSAICLTYLQKYSRIEVIVRARILPELSPPRSTAFVFGDKS